jgi:hypothetical protein
LNCVGQRIFLVGLNFCRRCAVAFASLFLHGLCAVRATIRSPAVRFHPVFGRRENRGLDWNVKLKNKKIDWIGIARIFRNPPIKQKRIEYS